MKIVTIVGVLLLSMGVQAKDGPSYQSGVLKDMTSVECGFEQKGAKGVLGEIVGTDNSHSTTRKTFCQEYVLETNRVVYRIRPRDVKHPALLPVGEKAMFRMKKELMVLKVPEGDGKEREYEVVSMTPTPNNPAAPNKLLPAAQTAVTPTAAQSNK